MDTNPVSTASEPTGSVELLSFRLGESEYSVDIMSVREIRGWTRTTALPHSPGYVRGVINLRGSVLPVVDLAVRLGLASGEPTDRNVIIVVDIDGRSLGLRVDAVSDILTLARSDLQSPPDMGSDAAASFVRDLTIIDGRMIRVLDLPAVLPAMVETAA
ncbi:MAG: chemotaxis protein CheW [Pseudomonadota bacterium]